MIYQAINPVAAPVLIISLHENSDKYIILFLHCRFYMSLPQIATSFFHYFVNIAGGEDPLQDGEWHPDCGCFN